MRNSPSPTTPMQQAESFLEEAKKREILIKRSNGTLVAVQIAFNPSPFTERCFNQAMETMPTFNLMVDRLASSEEFLSELQNELSCADPFMNKLFQVHESAKNARFKSKIIAGLSRNDFLQHASDNCIYQVELNTLSCSFLALSQKVTELLQAKAAGSQSKVNIPQNHCLTNAASFFAAIAAAYKEETASSSAKTVLFVCQPEESNLFDQILLQRALEERGIEVVRATLTELSQSLVFYPLNGSICVGGREIFAVYFRAGYTPTDYASEAEWETRICLEKSRAVKVPNVEYQLVGKKTVQLMLKRSETFQKYFPQPEFAAIPSMFTGVHSLSDEHVLRKVSQNPHAFVLKPQRDGGGNNIFGQEIIHKLFEEKDFPKAAYILMDIIHSPVATNDLLQDQGEGKFSLLEGVKVVSELGIYGAFLRKENGEILENSSLGYLLRTKLASSKESGIVAGFGYLDAPDLQ